MIETNAEDKILTTLLLTKIESVILMFFTFALVEKSIIRNAVLIEAPPKKRD